MSSLAAVQQLESFHSLYKQHIIQLLEWLAVSCEGWSCYSPEVLQFEVITTHSGTTYLVLKKIQSGSPQPADSLCFVMNSVTFRTFTRT